MAAFFHQPWSRLSPNLSEPDQAWLLNQAALRLRALGRLTEAMEPMRATLEINADDEQWTNASVVAGNLSELEVTLGRLESAVVDARRSIDFAERSGDAFERQTDRVIAADALHQSGVADEARGLFADAERMQQESQPQFDLLYSVRGFKFCDLLLAPAERAAWRAWLADRPYPWDSSPEVDLKEARRLIVEHGYGRRIPELEDAEAAFGIIPAEPGS